MKKGFSLSELIIVLGIIGIMVTLGLKSFSNNDNQIKYLYSSLYHSLDRAFYNTMLYWVPEDDYQRQPFKDSVSSNSVVTSVSDAQGAERLCKALVEYINTIDEACSASKAVDDSGEDSLFTPEKVQFEAFNGMRFWISKRYPETTSSSIADTNMKFFIVYADVNGVKLPNSLRYQQNDPDIFAFAAMEDGRVVPIGIAEFEPRFLTTRVIYSYWNEETNETERRYSKKSRPYVYSKTEAWGYYLDDPNVGEKAMIDGSPYTYNGYLRDIISSTSEIYSFMGDDTYTEYISRNDRLNDATFKSLSSESSSSSDNYGCVKLSDEECSIIIDKYR